MKILQLGKAYPPVNLGGVEVTIKLITEGLHSRQIHCDVIGVNNSTRRIVENKPFGLIIRSSLLLKAFSTLFSLDLLVQLNKIKNQYDIIHIHHPDPMAGFALWLTKPKCKIVLHWHSDILRQKFLLKFYKPFQDWILNRSDIILTTSPNYAFGSEYLRPYINKVKVLPIGIDKQNLVYDDTIVSKIKSTYANKKIILSIGRLAYYKGYNYLIDAFRLLDDNYVLLIIGEGSLYNSLLKQVNNSKLQKKVLFLGRVEDLYRNCYLRACDAFVLSSVYKTEAFGIVQIEAMSFKKPVLSTEIFGSGVSWVNKNEFSGITVPVKNSEEIAKGINKIFFSPFSYEVYSQGAEKRFNEVFTLEKMLNKLFDIYKDVLR